MAPETRTRFKIYVQSPILGPPFDEPQVISVNRPPSLIAAGPADVDTGTGEPLLYVLDAKKRRYDNKTPHCYDEFDGRPWIGARYRAVRPGPDGHYDHLDPERNSREFAQAAVYASVRFALEHWQKYFKKARQNGIRWHHRAQRSGVDTFLELNPWSKAVGARAGYGFLEFGHGPVQDDRRFSRQPLWQNFDVIAHELGHCMVFAALGFPSNMTKDTAWYSDANRRRNGAFLAFHESAGDLVAMVASLHHDSVIDYLLERTRGNLRRGANVVSRVGELRKAAPGDLGKLNSIRNAANQSKLGEVSVKKDGPHAYSLPLTGAIYDLFVDEFERQKPSRGNRAAIEVARDYLGELLARTWTSHLSADKLRYTKIRAALIAADREMGGHRRECIEANFGNRGIR